MSINDSVPVHNDWAAAYYIIVFCELIPRTDTEDIRNPLLSSLRKAQSAGPIRFDALCFLLSGEAGLTLPLRAPWAMQWHAAGTF